jgi:hypothetical protein
MSGSIGLEALRLARNRLLRPVTMTTKADEPVKGAGPPRVPGAFHTEIEYQAGVGDLEGLGPIRLREDVGLPPGNRPGSLSRGLRGSGGYLV